MHPRQVKNNDRPKASEPSANSIHKNGQSAPAVPFQLSTMETRDLPILNLRESPPPFQLQQLQKPPANTGALSSGQQVVQRVKMKIKNAYERDFVTIDHNDLLDALENINVPPTDSSLINIDSSRGKYFVEMKAVIAAIDIVLQSTLTDLDASLLKKRKDQLTDIISPKKRKMNEDQPDEKNEIPIIEEHTKKAKKEEDAIPLAAPQQATITTTTDEEMEEPEPDKPLKFASWNLNHFGKANALGEFEIREMVLILLEELQRINPDPKHKEIDLINQLKTTIISQINTFNQVITPSLPNFKKTKEVNSMMEIIGNIKHHFKTLKSKGLAGASKKKKNNSNVTSDLFVPAHNYFKMIAGSLKKIYIIQHANHLMDEHDNLILGMNEVGQGINNMEQQMGEHRENDAKGRIILKKGPKLQSVSIDTKKLHAAVAAHDKISKLNIGPLETIKNPDLKNRENYLAFTKLGKPADLLKQSQIEYYPVAFNESKYEYMGCISIASDGSELNNEEIKWTKNPYLKGNILFRPIVVHKFKRRNSRGKPYGEMLWYGIIHTTPGGDEFDRRSIYQKQLATSLPALKKLAQTENARVMTGGDLYIADEAIVNMPPDLRNTTTKYTTKDNYAFVLPTKDIKQRGLQSNRSIGLSINSKGEKFLHTGTSDSVRNLQHPDDQKQPSVFNMSRTMVQQGQTTGRSITGTNENTLGNQSADYFIFDPLQYGHYMAGVIDPATGKPQIMENENKDISNSWYKFSDHLPVMIVASTGTDKDSVQKEFKNNKEHFNNNATVHDFDLLYADIVSTFNAIRDTIPDKEKQIIQGLIAELHQLRNAPLSLNDLLQQVGQLKDYISFIQACKNLTPITREDFEIDPGDLSIITTLLHKMRSEIITQIPDHPFLETLNGTTEIIKEDKINSEFSLGLKYPDKRIRLSAGEIALLDRSMLAKLAGMATEIEDTRKLLGGFPGYRKDQIAALKKQIEKRQKKDQQPIIDNRYKELDIELDNLGKLESGKTNEFIAAKKEIVSTLLLSVQTQISADPTINTIPALKDTIQVFNDMIKRYS